MSMSYGFGNTRERLSYSFRLWTIVLGVLVLAWVSSLSAQEYRATVRGTVTDTSQAAIPGATVTLVNINTGVKTIRQTNPSGLYIFEAVQPGKYSVTVNARGFAQFVSENITVVTFGDVTVNATLRVGSTTQTVTVTGQSSLLQFNTASVSTIVEGAALEDMPVYGRSTFALGALDSSVVEKTAPSTMVPFYENEDQNMTIGGPNADKNNLEIDGTPFSSGGYGSYTPNMVDVQELSVQENPVDASYGFSAGASVSVSTKSGTDQFHGSAYYFGQNTALNALTDRVSRTVVPIHDNEWGASLGNPIIKNKLFNFFDYEGWRWATPSEYIFTMPTVAERSGDFSQAKTPQGAERVIYDPTTTVYNPSTSTVTRTPFPGNIIPADRIDPTGNRMVNQLWLPNTVPDSPDGENNFRLTVPDSVRYLNYSERLDYEGNKWRIFGRISQMWNTYGVPEWGGVATPSGDDGIMHASNVDGDAVWLLSPHTTVDFRMGYTRNEDDYSSAVAQAEVGGQSTWAKLWPNNDWYQPTLAPVLSTGVYYPGMFYDGIVDGANTGIGAWWLVHNRDFAPSVAFTHMVGRHEMKWGWQLRYQIQTGDAGIMGPGDWYFNSIDTGSTFLSSYNPAQSGDMYASGLLGVVDKGSANISPIVTVHSQEWGLYYQDDVRLNRRVTLNLGLRWEREPAPAEVQHRLVQTIDLNTPLTALQGIQMPSQVTSIANVPYKFDGAMNYTSSSDPRLFDATWGLFEPRAGIAIRINDKTAIRAGYGRFATPFVADTLDNIYYPYNGYASQTSVLSPVAGVPQTYISNPYPASNPLVLPYGNSLGAYSGVGDSSISFWESSIHPTPETDQINVGIQHTWPGDIFTDATFFMAFSHNLLPGTSLQAYNINQMNPEIAYTHPGLTEQSVPNPFYGLSKNIMPGVLSSEPTVPASQLLTPYPQYGALYVNSWPGVSDHYYALTLKAQRQMAKGLMFIASYTYNQEYEDQFFNPEDEYLNHYTMLDGMLPRHNLRLSGDWQLPVGRGRAFLSNMPRVLDALIGGWSTADIFSLRSGDLLNFGQAEVTCNPTQNVPAGDYFNPSCFQVAPPDTPRTNPWYYEGLRGPAYWELDSTLQKSFNLTSDGRVKLELRMDFYNMPNSFMPADPDLTVGSGTMGKSVSESGFNTGREMQYTTRLQF